MSLLVKWCALGWKVLSIIEEEKKVTRKEEWVNTSCKQKERRYSEWKFKCNYEQRITERRKERLISKIDGYKPKRNVTEKEISDT